MDVTGVKRWPPEEIKAALATKGFDPEEVDMITGIITNSVSKLIMHRPGIMSGAQISEYVNSFMEKLFSRGGRPAMSRDRFIQLMNENLVKVKKLFEEKNKSYARGGEDAFYNFRANAIRLHGDGTPENMYKILYAQMDKHLVALANNALDDPEFEQRCLDNINYNLIALGIFKEYKGEV